MEIISLILLSIGLSFDTFAVSISSGIFANYINFWQGTRIAITFAFFQSLFPLIGWFFGIQIKHIIIDYDHWLAFILLSLIGIKMIYESRKPTENRNPSDPFNLKILLMMAVATSIDALIVGVSFAFIEVNIYIAMFIIGISTYIMSMLGLLFGKTFGIKFGVKMEIIGGLVLIAIGTKILIEHLIVDKGF